jgi:hypothetical protein
LILNNGGVIASNRAGIKEGDVLKGKFVAAILRPE